MLGGTSRLERRTAGQRDHSNTVLFQCSLPSGAKSEIARAASVAASYNIRALSFCVGHACKRHFAQSIFEIGQNVPESERTDPKSYLPGRAAVTYVVRDLFASLLTRFEAYIKDLLPKYGLSITCGGIHLRLQGKPYYDLTLHVMEVKDIGTFEKVSFRLRNITL